MAPNLFPFAVPSVGALMSCSEAIVNTCPVLFACHLYGVLWFLHCDAACYFTLPLSCFAVLGPAVLRSCGLISG